MVEGMEGKGFILKERVRKDRVVFLVGRWSDNFGLCRLTKPKTIERVEVVD